MLIEELGPRPPWLAVVTEEGYHRHCRTDTPRHRGDAGGVDVLEHTMLHPWTWARHDEPDWRKGIWNEPIECAADGRRPGVWGTTLPRWRKAGHGRAAPGPSVRGAPSPKPP